MSQSSTCKGANNSFKLCKHWINKIIKSPLLWRWISSLHLHHCHLQLFPPDAELSCLEAAYTRNNSGHTARATEHHVRMFWWHSVNFKHILQINVNFAYKHKLLHIHTDIIHSWITKESIRIITLRNSYYTKKKTSVTLTNMSFCMISSHQPVCYSVWLCDVGKYAL